VCSKNALITLRLLKSKHKKLRDAGISKKGYHDFALGSLHIVLPDIKLYSHRVDEGLWGRAVNKLATLRRVEDDVGAREERNAGRLVGAGAAAEHGGYGGAGVTPSISLTCSGAAMEPSFACTPAAGAVNCRACLRVVLVGGERWPWFAVKGGGVGVGENGREGS
jgi:hypothetical protein